MFISFVLIQVKTSTGQFHLTPYTPITVGTGVYLLSDGTQSHNVIHLRQIGQV
ncbi:MAG: hypothetical protein J7K51_09230 [Thermotogae bacterium]|nr:hypothetical protein [Thermotogota bacterium]